MEWVSVPLAALDGEGRATIEVGGRRIAVFRVADEVHAVGNDCPHAGNPLVEGELLGGVLTCAYHGWKFDLASGACLHGEEPVQRYPAEIRYDKIWVLVD